MYILYKRKCQNIDIEQVQSCPEPMLIQDAYINRRVPLKTNKK